eukprot:5086860-Pyramimonas_sp.AAC.1
MRTSLLRRGVESLACEVSSLTTELVIHAPPLPTTATLIRIENWGPLSSTPYPRITRPYSSYDWAYSAGIGCGGQPGGHAGEDGPTRGGGGGASAGDFHPGGDRPGLFRRRQRHRRLREPAQNPGACVCVTERVPYA